MKFAVLFASAVWAAGAVAGADIRIGIIGCDTSHVIAFTENLNQPDAKDHVPGGKVVAAFRGGSPDVPESADRVEGYARTLKEKYGVQFYDRISDLCANVDAILLESVDGRPHLEQFRQILKADHRPNPEHGAFALLNGATSVRQKPVFIDKPMAGSLHDVIEIFRLAKRTQTPVFSSSALRFARDTQAVARGSLGPVLQAETFGPCEIEKHHPDLFWYGVHGVEALYAVMGTGCESVQRDLTPAGKIQVVGAWPGGRKGIFREEPKFHGLAKGEKGEGSVGSFEGYVPLIGEIMRFFESGVAPVKAEETIEIFAFMEAADASKASGGGPVKLSTILETAGN